VSVVRKPKTNLERLFDGENVRRVFRHLSVDDTADGYLRKC
jgi:hypothetical protein